MGILGWILLGLIAGAIAKAIMPGDDPGGILLTMVIGIIGAIIGGLIANAFGWAGIGDFFEIRTWILAIVGSLILLAIVRAASNHRRPLTH